MHVHSLGQREKDVEKVINLLAMEIETNCCIRA